MDKVGLTVFGDGIQAPVLLFVLVTADRSKKLDCGKKNSYKQTCKSRARLNILIKIAPN